MLDFIMFIYIFYITGCWSYIDLMLEYYNNIYYID